MPKSTKCLVKVRGTEEFKKQSIAEALRIRADNKRFDHPDPHRFCVECKWRVIPTKESRNIAAHFEHHPWNFDCSLRHRQWDAQRLQRRLTTTKGLTAEDSSVVMQRLMEKLEIEGITFREFIDRVQSSGIKLDELCNAPRSSPVILSR